MSCNDMRKIFLAANSAEGFVSFFNECYSARDGWCAYIIKGGPGTGKSSFMMTVAKALKNEGLDPILCYCSSDPGSLDGVIIEEKKAVILDGTPPHTVEPSYYGACEKIVNLGDNLDCGKMRERLTELLPLFDKNSFYHKTAARYLSAYGQLKYDNLKLARDCLDIKKADIFSKKLASNYIPYSSPDKKGKRVNCFLGGTTPYGIINYTETVENSTENIVVIEDKYGAASGHILQYLANYAVVSGYGTVVVKNQFLPSEIIDHIIIPELSLAFVSENENIKFNNKNRKIHSKRFYDTDALRLHRSRMFFNRRIGKNLLLSAVENLKHAKSVHDDIEFFYVSCMNFVQNEIKAKEIAEEIMNKK